MGRLTEARELWAMDAYTGIIDNIPADTLAALLDVASDAEAEQFCPFCGRPRHSPEYTQRPHADDCPLTPLVKED
jgi:hypothetical protein